MLNLFVKVYQVIMQNDNKYSIDNNPVSKASCCASFKKNRTKIENSGKNNEKNTRNN